MKNWPNFGQFWQKSTNNLRISDLKKKKNNYNWKIGESYYRIGEGVIL